MSVHMHTSSRTLDTLFQGVFPMVEMTAPIYILAMGQTHTATTPISPAMHHPFHYPWNGSELSRWSYPIKSTTTYVSTSAYRNSENPGFFQLQNEQYGQSSHNEPQFFSGSHGATGEGFPYAGSHLRSDGVLAVRVNASTG